MLDTVFVAKMCHEVNRAYCEALGDHSQVAWKDAEEWQRESAVDGVIYKLIYPLATPAEQHENWCKAKQADGWIYGPEKDAEKRTHPCLVAYDQLPVAQRAKDHIFCAVVATLAPFVEIDGLEHAV